MNTRGNNPLKQSQKIFYLFGLPIITLAKNDNVTEVMLGPRIPLFKITRSNQSIRLFIGCLEIFKYRIKKELGFDDSSRALLPINTSSKRTLYINIDNLQDVKETTGIPRVAKNLLNNLMQYSGENINICPVVPSQKHQGFVRASYYLEKNFPELGVQDIDYPILFHEGDILFFPIPLLKTVLDHKIFLSELKFQGVYVVFILYDLIPTLYPEFVTDRTAQEMGQWLFEISRYSGILAISQTVEQEYLTWYEKNIKTIGKPLQHSWFHLGSELGIYRKGVTPNPSDPVFLAMKKAPSLILVSTVEPRKGHRQALAAFELLWKKGIDINFIIVGKLGWKMDDFEQRATSHPENNRHFFWFQNASDAYLEAVYTYCSGVLMPSEAEGFGLAIVEGAKHGKSLILRDIPIFREIAGENAVYFSGLEPKNLADALEQWLSLYISGTVPDSKNISILTWKQSSENMLENLLNMCRKNNKEIRNE